MIQLLFPIMRGPFFILLGLYCALVFSDKIKTRKNEERWEAFVAPRKKMLINAGMLLVVLGAIRFFLDIIG